MTTVDKLIPQGRGLAAVLLKRATTVELDWARRSQGALQVRDSSGRELDIRLAEDSALRGGDVLVAADGTLVRVLAAAEPVWRVEPCAEHGSPFDLARAAYQLGRRALPLQLRDGALVVLPDAALRADLDAWHLIVTEVQAAFEPDAVQAPHAHGPGCGHDPAQHHHDHHHHSHDHAHDHHHHGAHDHGAHDHDHAHHDHHHNHDHHRHR